jgi:hypothetical protein
VSSDTRKRPWLAALLAFAQPGLGHAYLRSWLRAVLWFGLWAATVTLVVELPALPLSDPISFISALFTSMNDLPLRSTLALASVTSFSMLDAYWLAARNAASGDQFADEPTCPSCGREIDPSLDFCHWCTAELDEPNSADHATDAR